MKKIFSVFLALTMLVGMMAMFAVSASAASTSAPLSAAFYTVDNDPGYAYVVFNKKVKAPVAEDGVALSLVGYAWPTDESKPTENWRYTRRMDKPFVTAVSDQVWKFDINTPSEGAAGSWFLTNCAAGEKNHFKTNVGIDAIFYYALIGTVTTADGSETLALDTTKDLLNDALNGDARHGYKLLKGTAASVDAIPVPSLNPLTAVAFSPKENETADGWEHEYVYVVFNKPMKAPAADVKIAVTGNWTYSNWAYNVSDVIEVVNDYVWRFTNSAYLAAAKDGSNSYFNEVNIVNGFYPANNVANLDVRLFGTVEAQDGTKLEMILDGFDLGLPDTHAFPNRVHFKADGTDYGTGYSLNWSVAEKLADIHSTLAPAPETQAPEVSTDDVVVPPQGDVLSVVALVAVIGILGTAVVAKKRK
ncbi:MAG: hypothetical protein E7618_00570 [Ruminococcaceae bacterium]|nr:hypothetical protein [Oscillospiraceae bacterium]